MSWQNQVLVLLLRANRYFFVRSNELDVAGERRQLDRLGKLFKPLAALESTPVLINELSAEWVLPAGTSPERVILYLHGGAFNSGSVMSHRSLAGNLAITSKARALVIDYRLAPEHPFPFALQDSLAAYEWLLASGIAADQIAVIGDSAGGTLTLMLLLQLRDQGKALPRLAVCLSPLTDLTMSGQSWDSNRDNDVMLLHKFIKASIELFLRDIDPHLPLVSPLNADIHGLPPLLIQVGSNEVFLSDCERFAEKAKQVGVPITLEVWEGMQHVWQFAASVLPEGRQAIRKIGEFVDRVYTGGSSSTSG